MKVILTYNSRLQSHVLILSTVFGSMRFAAIRDTDEFALVQPQLEYLIRVGKSAGMGEVVAELDAGVVDTLNNIRHTLDNANVQQLA